MKKGFYTAFNILFLVLPVIAITIRVTTDTAGWLTVFLMIGAFIVFPITYLLSSLPMILMLFRRNLTDSIAIKIKVAAFTMLFSTFVFLLSFKDSGDSSAVFSIFGESLGMILSTITFFLSFVAWICLMVFSGIAARRFPKLQPFEKDFRNAS